MKKLLTLVSVIGMFTFMACGPSAAELEAKAKATADSIANVEKIAEEAAALELAAVKAKASADSIIAAEALAAAKAPEPKKEEAKHHTTKPTKGTAPVVPASAPTPTAKAGQGRG